MRSSSSVRPFLKWAGGKQGLASTLVPMFPARFDRYFEPFVGGASVFLHFRPLRATLSDSNQWLIDTFIAVRDHWSDVAAVLDVLKNDRQEFHRIRGVDPATVPLVQRAAHFIYLNKTCFRGLYRVNKAGRFNVPYGAYERRYYDRSELEQTSRALASAEICCRDFEDVSKVAGSGDFVYLDPPYYKLGGYADFNRYTPTQFRDADHVRLANFCRSLDLRGTRWALSNSDTDFVRKLYAGYHVTSISARREINLDPSKRNATELLITNYPPTEAPALT